MSNQIPSSVLGVQSELLDCGLISSTSLWAVVNFFPHELSRYGITGVPCTPKDLIAHKLPHTTPLEPFSPTE
ncbi:hypothetical protein CEXT_5831 [Caerostris extrusa]|uniref:Uncharacterized protein n=1 Tax=Caerostris extrusa TaxID=172846 RepID=A0AAV4SRL6_CAEEX|nr:hypothetical protein CEXT_5831 [Caerostris extrusa]